MQNIAAVSHLQAVNPFAIPLTSAAHRLSYLAQQKEESRLKI